MDDIDFGRALQVTGQIGDYIVRKRFPFSKAELSDGQHRTSYHSGDYFGAKNATYGVSLQFAIPNFSRGGSWALAVDTSPYELDNTKNPQIKLFIDDKMVAVFDVNHRYCRISDDWLTSDGQFKAQLEIFSGREDKKYPLHAQLIEFDQPTFSGYFDFRTYADCWQVLKKDPVADKVYRTAFRNALQLLDLRTPYSADWENSISQACASLHQQLDQQPFDPAQGTVYAIGHTHIDMAWLWTLAQTIEKGERSFTSVLNLMKEYPEFKFLHSTPQLYALIKKHYPKLYAQIKDAVQRGQWEPEGAMWVEADTNLPSGESLVRQILYGKRFFKKEFGIDSKILWLPDVFGYSAALPQILRKSGVPYFMTTKLAWNDTDEIPFDSFQWQGIDGSQVLSHLINTVSEDYSPTPWFSTYNGLLNARVVKKSWDRYKQKMESDQILLAYGYGDGGGGPTFSMVETLKRLQKHVWGMPMVKSATALSFFQALAKDASTKPLPTWMGELYFEFHRGTYTSIAKNKKNNRRAETALSAVEKLYAIYDLAHYPAEQLSQLWETTLLDQFHDVLPGSAIKEVYDDTDRNYSTLFTALSKQQQDFAERSLKKASNKVVLFNPAGEKMWHIVTLSVPDGDCVIDSNGKALPMQRDTHGYALVQATLPALSMTEITVTPSSSPVDNNSEAPRPLGNSYETEYYKLTFDAHFSLVGVYDKRWKRQIVPKGGYFNHLMVFSDFPREYDAWNIDSDYERKSWPMDAVVSAEIVSQGLIFDTLQIVYQYAHSVIRQQIHLYHDSPRIAFQTHLDWHEHHALLRTLFDIDVNAKKADFDIQFGNISRQIAKNTSWEQAQFEVPAHKWADMSETGYGVSVITDAKYGYSARYKQLGITLVKSATEPNPVADQGVQDFTYEVLPHSGDWREAGTMAEAVRLNTPPVVWTGFALPKTDTDLGSFVSCDHSNVLVDTIKKAEDSNNIIIRLFENENKRTDVTLTFNHPVKRAVLCNLLEHEERLLNVSSDGRRVVVSFKPYEIQTVEISR